MIYSQGPSGCNSLNVLVCGELPGNAPKRTPMYSALDVYESLNNGLYRDFLDHNFPARDPAMTQTTIASMLYTS